MKKGAKKEVKIILTIFTILFIIFITLFLIRLVTPTEIDDISPGISCPEIAVYNPDILYVIPNYNNNPIPQNKEWCDYILSLNKTIRMHGITHEYREFFYQNISQEELTFGISEFKNCFGFKPEAFKSPQLKTTHENKQLIQQNNLKFLTVFNQVTHKVYHCNDSAKPHNNIINMF